MNGFLLWTHRAQKKSKKLKKILQKLLVKKKQVILLFSLPTVLFIVLILIVISDNSLRNEIYVERLFPISFQVPTQAPYPTINSKTIYPQISAKAAIVIDDDSKVVLFSKNSDQILPMASTTKIMTALIALQAYKPNDVLIADGANISGVTIGLKKDERMFFKDLLYGMLLPSGNDVAYTLSTNYPGGEKEFINEMNQKAKELKLNNTHFEDPIGLSENNYTTALDLSRLASIAIKNPVFREVVSTKNKTIKDRSGLTEYKLTNLNKLLGQNGVNGIKTGFTDEAGEVLVTSRKDNNHTTIIVVMKSEDRFADTKEMLSLINGNLIYQSIHP